MDFTLKVVMNIPVHQLWTNAGFIEAERGRKLTVADIKSILPDILFVVADVGTPLKWINKYEVFDFWKNDAREHIWEGEANLDDAPGGYVYRATEWAEKKGNRIVLLEKYH